MVDNEYSNLFLKHERLCIDYTDISSLKRSFPSSLIMSVEGLVGVRHCLLLIFLDFSFSFNFVLDLFIFSEVPSVFDPLVVTLLISSDWLL